MAFDRATEYPGQVDTDPDYPQGKPRNETTEGDGTGYPWEEKVAQDYEGFHQSLLFHGRVTPSGNPDKVGASDYLTGLKRLLQPLAVLTWDKPALVTQNDLPVDPSSNKAVTIAPDTYLGTADKLVTTPDGGSTWAPVTLGSPTGVVMLCGAMDPNGTKGIFTGSKGGGTDIQTSSAVGSYPLGGFTPITPPGTPVSLTCALFDSTTSRFIVIGKTGSAPYIATCELADLTTWTQRTVPASITGANDGLSLVQIGSTIVASWATQTKVAYSTDGGVTWTASTTNLTSASYRVEAGDRKFVALSISSTKVYNSSDGITWTPLTDLTRNGGPDLTRWGFKFLGGVFIARGPTAVAFYYSIDDGVTWTEVFEQNRTFVSFCVIRKRLLIFRSQPNGGNVDAYMERSGATDLPG